MGRGFSGALIIQENCYFPLGKYQLVTDSGYLGFAPLFEKGAKFIVPEAKLPSSAILPLAQMTVAMWHTRLCHNYKANLES